MNSCSEEDPYARPEAARPEGPSSASNASPGVDSLDRFRVAELLSEIEAAGEYYISSSLTQDSPVSIMLRALAREEYIHWCPYPEEFYIIRPRGIELLRQLRSSAS